MARLYVLCYLVKKDILILFEGKDQKGKLLRLLLWCDFIL